MYALFISNCSQSFILNNDILYSKSTYSRNMIGSSDNLEDESVDDNDGIIITTFCRFRYCVLEVRENAS